MSDNCWKCAQAKVGGTPCDLHEAELPSVRSEPLLGCPFCGAIPEKMGNTTSVWVPHKSDCFFRPAALSELGQIRWNQRQPNAPADRPAAPAGTVRPDVGTGLEDTCQH